MSHATRLYASQSKTFLRSAQSICLGTTLQLFPKELSFYSALLNKMPIPKAQSIITLVNKHAT